MKKLLLVIVMLLCYTGVFAQQNGALNCIQKQQIKSGSVSAKQSHKIIRNTVEKQSVSEPGNVNHAKTISASVHQTSASEAIIGTTIFDLQTNGSISNCLVNNGDGTFSAAWTMSHIAWSFPDRGSGYNYFDGTSWGAQPSARIETVRTGFSNVAVAASGVEAVLAHSPGYANRLVLTHRPVKGTGSWIDDSIPGATAYSGWPKFIAGGTNGQSFHAIWLGSDNIPAPIYYSRSTDNGTTWSTEAQIPGLDTGTFYLGWRADSYSIDARGDVIAIVAAMSLEDVVLMKSTNNGLTWSKTIIDSFPIALYNSATMTSDTNADGVADTLFTNASDASVILDNNNIAHVFFGGTKMYCDSPGINSGQGAQYFPAKNLYYWHEGMQVNSAFAIARPPDFNGDGILNLPIGCGHDSTNAPIGYYATPLRSYIESPSAGVDANNNLYVVYQAIDELSDTGLYGMAYMHPYIIKSTNGGVTWTNPDSAYDVIKATQPLRQSMCDGVFASMAKRVDNKIHLIYERDTIPGLIVPSGNLSCETSINNFGTNEIVYVAIDTNLSSTGVNEINYSFSISSIYPNPFNGKTSFDINLKKVSDVTVEVVSLLGQVLSSNKFSNLNTGLHTLTIDGSNLSAGIYFYKVKAGNEVVTQKMIVQ